MSVRSPSSCQVYCCCKVALFIVSSWSQTLPNISFRYCYPRSLLACSFSFLSDRQSINDAAAASRHLKCMSKKRPKKVIEKETNRIVSDCSYCPIQADKRGELSVVHVFSLYFCHGLKLIGAKTSLNERTTEREEIKVSVGLDYNWLRTKTLHVLLPLRSHLEAQARNNTIFGVFCMLYKNTSITSMSGQIFDPARKPNMWLKY